MGIFKTFLRASFHLLSPDWQVQTYVQTFTHDDSNIWNSFGWSRWGWSRCGWAVWGRGKSHKSSVINQIWHLLALIYYWCCAAMHAHLLTPAISCSMVWPLGPCIRLGFARWLTALYGGKPEYGQPRSKSIMSEEQSEPLVGSVGAWSCPQDQVFRGLDQCLITSIRESRVQ